MFIEQPGSGVARPKAFVGPLRKDARPIAPKHQRSFVAILKDEIA
jgi:hypothetical protein